MKQERERGEMVWEGEGEGKGEWEGRVGRESGKGEGEMG